MKKIREVFLLWILFSVMLAGCGSPAASMNLPSQGAPDSSLESAADIELPVEEETDGTQTTPGILLPPPTGDVVEIREKMFIAQSNDIYFNPEDYLGKTIKYEGIFTVFEIPETGELFHSVIRYGPGCCGVDANAGFEVTWDQEYPNSDDWVEVVGVLEEYEYEGYMYLRLAVTSLTVLPVRGAEYVEQ